MGFARVVSILSIATQRGEQFTTPTSRITQTLLGYDEYLEGASITYKDAPHS